MERKIFSVSELNECLKAYIDADPLFSSLCVAGEISNYKLYPSGHHYFTLKDADSAISCVMFKGNALSLRFRPGNGMKVLAAGRVSVYPRDGKYQLYCNTLMPVGAGDLQLAFEQLKQKLEQEGLFSEAHKKPLPIFPGKIALITSPVGAAVRDMIRILGCRWPMASVIVVPSKVQGGEAPAELCAALRLVNEKKLADLIIIGRGGGSLEDLWAFNDENLAREIYASHIPVISAVGHEPDITISDYAADKRASTPSNAAEIAVPDREEISALLHGFDSRCGSAFHKKLSLLRKELEALSSKRVLHDPEEYINLRRMELDMLTSRLESAQKLFLSSAREKLKASASSLDAMSPLKVLSRGFALTMDSDGKPVHNAAELSAGENIRLLFRDGSAECRVESTAVKDGGML